MQNMAKDITKGEVLGVVGRGTFLNTLFSVLSKVIGIAFVVIVLTRLSVYEYGLMELVLSLVAIFNFLSLPGLGATIISDMSAEIGKGNGLAAKSILMNFFRIQFIFSIVAFVLVLFFGSFLGRFSHSSSIYFFILAFTFITSPFRSLFLSTFSVSHEFFKANIFGFFEDLSKLSIVSVFVFMQKTDLDTIFLSSVLAPIIPLIILFPFFIKTLRSFNFGLDKKISITHYLFNHGMWGVFANYTNGFGQSIRLWIVKLFLGTEAVALVSLAQNLMSHTISMLNFQSALGPVLSRYASNLKKLSVLAVKSIKYQMIAFSLVAVSVAIVFPPILIKFFPKYVPAIPIFLVMLISVIPQSFAAILTPLYRTLKSQKELFFAILVKNAFIVIYSVIFLPILGVSGIAIEYILTSVTFAVDRCIRIRKKLPDFSINAKTVFSFDENDQYVFDAIKRKFFKVGSLIYRFKK